MMDAPARKISLGGLKLSWELIQIRFSPKAGFPVTDFFRLLTDRQINLIGATLDAADGPLTGVCCISAEDRLPAEQALQPFKGFFEMRSPVGTLTLFPIQSRLPLVGQVLSVLSQAGIPLYGMASSLSSLTVTTDYSRLDDAVEAVCQIVTLPDNHAPFRPEFRVKQL